MSIGPVEIVAVEFPQDWVSDDVRARIVDLVDRGVVRVLDALLVTRKEDRSVVVIELEEADDDFAAHLGAIAQRIDLVAAEDVETLAEQLAPGTTALVLAFEHTWMVPVRDAVVASGGSLVADIHISADVATEVLAALERA